MAPNNALERTVTGRRVRAASASLDYALAAHMTRGRADFKTPRGLNFKAAVNVYGDCRNLSEYSKTIPTTVIIGDLENEDRLAPCKILATQSPPSIKVYVLSGTYHGFDQDDITTVRTDAYGNPMLYSGEATKRAREITKEFLAQYLGK